MSADHDVYSGPPRIEIEPVSVVQHAEPKALHLHDVKSGQGARPGAGIHISPHSGHRGDVPQCGQDIRTADIAGMHDSSNRLKKFGHCGMKKPVRVGNHSDPGLMVLFYPCGHALLLHSVSRPPLPLTARATACCRIENLSNIGRENKPYPQLDFPNGFGYNCLHIFSMLHCDDPVSSAKEPAGRQHYAPAALN